MDSATYGIPCESASSELLRVTREWAAAEYEPRSCEEAIARARAAFARMHGISDSRVAIGHQVAPLVASCCAAIKRPGTVLVAEGDFTSLTFPFVAAGREVVSVPLGELAAHIRPDTAVVAVSAVQSADGALADIDALVAAAAEHETFTLIDTTQSSGWLPLDASRFDAVVAGGYKWLCNPRGTAFMAVGERLLDSVPIMASWYAGEDPWASCYELSLRLAPDARRFDVSPAWLNWHAAAAALERLEHEGIDEINAHNLTLASRVRDAFGLAPCRSAIVSLPVPQAIAQRLQEAGIRASVRAGRLRISCHVYNDAADVDHLLNVMEDCLPQLSASTGLMDQ